MPDHILVVDDEREIADLVVLYLQNEGFRVSKAYDAAGALELVGSEPLDLAVLDVMLPDMDGFQLCQRIRETRRFTIIIGTLKLAIFAHLISIHHMRRIAIFGSYFF